MTLDFAGTAPLVNGPINVTKNGLLATAFYSLKALIAPGIPSKAGIYRAFEVKAEPGLIINAVNRALTGCNSSCTSVIFSGANPKDT